MRLGIKKFYQDVVYESRWALALFNIGLLLGMGYYIYQFGSEIVEIIEKLFVHHEETNESTTMLALLSLVDMAMIAQMIIFIIQGSHIIFVGDLNAEDDAKKPRVLQAITSTSLKVKLFQSLVGISAVALLRTMVDMHDFDWSKVETQLQLYSIITRAAVQMGIHLLFVHSTRVLAKIDLDYHPPHSHHDDKKDKEKETTTDNEEKKH